MSHLFTMWKKSSKNEFIANSTLPVSEPAPPPSWGGSARALPLSHSAQVRNYATLDGFNVGQSSSNSSAN